jgi:hypothetical protein
VDGNAAHGHRSAQLACDAGEPLGKKH